VSTLNFFDNIYSNLFEIQKSSVTKFLGILKEYSKQINIISKIITDEQLNSLIDETLIMEKLISEDHVVDAGSGNGILGIPIAILNPEKMIFLVEPRKKKSEFLIYAVKELSLNNAEVIRSGIEEFFKSRKKQKLTLIGRGFPDNLKLAGYVKKGIASELILITSEYKIKKMEKGIEKLGQKIYNVPFRDNLKIIHITDVSRET